MSIKGRTTPEHITALEKNQIFVFGSNESGVHGAGAAKYACLNFGAVWNLGFGFSGKSFAIPTKDWKIAPLGLIKIDFYVQRFLDFAKGRPDLIFLVTPIGTGLAGRHIEDIAPMFLRGPINATEMKNIHLPRSFWDF